MVGGPVEIVVIVVLLDTVVATSEGASTAASAVAWPAMRGRKTNDSNPDRRLAPIQKLRAEVTECKACAKASGHLNV